MHDPGYQLQLKPQLSLDSDAQTQDSEQLES